MDSYDYDAPWFSHQSDVTSIEIGEGVTSLGVTAFYGFDNLASVEFPSTLISIGLEAFGECTALSSITLPSNLQCIGNYAFGCCESLVSINCDTQGYFVIPEGVLTIGERAFSSCCGLTRLYLPSTLTSIGAELTRYCPNNIDIIVESSTPIICNGWQESDDYSSWSGKFTLYVPDAEAVTAYKNPTYKWYDPDIKNYTTSDDEWYDLVSYISDVKTYAELPGGYESPWAASSPTTPEPATGVETNVIVPSALVLLCGSVLMAYVLNARKKQY